MTEDVGQERVADDGRAFWNSWNAHHRETAQDHTSLDQARVVERWLGDRRSGLKRAS